MRYKSTTTERSRLRSRKTDPKYLQEVMNNGGEIRTRTTTPIRFFITFIDAQNFLEPWFILYPGRYRILRKWMHQLPGHRDLRRPAVGRKWPGLQIWVRG